MSYGSASSRCATEERADPARGQGRRGPGRRGGQRVRAGQPARVPGQPAARDHGRRRRARRPADGLLERERGGRPQRAGPRHPHRGPGARSTPTDGTRDGFAFVDGTSFSVADGGGRGRVGPRRAARADPVPGRAGRARSARATSAGAATRTRPASACSTCPARSRAGRPPTTRRSPTTTSATSTAARSASRPPRCSAAARRAIAATADYAEDPVDVYRLKLRAGRRVRLDARPRRSATRTCSCSARGARSVRSSRSLAQLVARRRRDRAR